MKALVLRVLNELPTLTVVALTLAGVDQADYHAAVEFAGAVSVFGTWLFARHQLDGPVTVMKRRS